MEIKKTSNKTFLFAVAFMSCSFINAQTTKSDTISTKAIATSYITEVVNKKNLSLINKLYSARYIYHGMDGSEMNTIQDSSLFNFLTYLFKAFPDLHYSIDHAIAEADMVSLCLTGRATHKDEFLGFPASNKKIEFKEMFFFKIINGKITEGWGIVDLDGVKNQISK